MSRCIVLLTLTALVGCGPKPPPSPVPVVAADPVPPFTPAKLAAVVAPPDTSKPLLTFGDTRFRHTGYITGLAFHPDGKTIAASASGESFIRIWDTATGKEVKRYDLDGNLGPNDSGYRVVLGYSTDGKRLIHTGRKNELVIRDTATGKPVATLDADGTAPYTLALSPDASCLAFRNLGGRLVIHDTDTGQLIRDLGELSVYADTRENGRVVIRDPVRVAFSPNGKRVIATAHTNGFHVGSADGSDPLAFHQLRCERASDVYWPSAEWAVVVGGRSDGADYVTLDTATWKPVSTRNYRTSGLDSVSRVPLSGKLVCKLRNEREVSVGYVLVDPDTLDPTRGTELVVPNPHAAGYHLGPGNLVATWHHSAIQVFDRKTGKSAVPELDRMPLSGGGHLYPSADGKRVLVSNVNSIDHALRVWDATTGQLLSVLNADRFLYISGLVFAPNGQWVAANVGHTAFGVVVWDTATGKEHVRQTVPPPKEGEAVWSVRAVGFAAEGLWVMDVKTGEFRLLDLPSGKVLRTLAGFKDVWHVCLSPDGKRLAASGWEGVVVRSLDPDGKWEILQPFKRENQVSWDAEWCGNGKAFLPHPPRIGFGPTGEVVTERFGIVQLPKRSDIPPRALPAWVDVRGPHEIGFGAKSYSPDGRRRYAPSDRFVEPTDGVIVTEVATARVLGRLPVPCSGGLAVSQDGTRLYTSYADTTIGVWDLPALEVKHLPNVAVADHWSALASPDATVGYSAVRQLAADPKAVEWLRECFAKPRQNPLGELIADLGHQDFRTREAATKALGEMGVIVYPDLRQVVERRPSEEAAERAERLLAPREGRPYQEWAGLSLDQVREVRAVEVLELAGTPAAVEVLTEWAKGKSPVRKAEAAAALTRLPRKK